MLAEGCDSWSTSSSTRRRCTKKQVHDQPVMGRANSLDLLTVRGAKVGEELMARVRVPENRYRSGSLDDNRCFEAARSEVGVKGRHQFKINENLNLIPG